MVTGSMMGASYFGPGMWDFDRSVFVWRLKFVWWPKRSDQSGQRIWLRRAWHGYRLISGPGTPVQVDVWLTEEEYTWQCMIGDVKWYQS